jgi:hypothetical protein
MFRRTKSSPAGEAHLNLHEEPTPQSDEVQVGSAASTAA